MTWYFYPFFTPVYNEPILDILDQYNRLVVTFVERIAYYASFFSNI